MAKIGLNLYSLREYTGTPEEFKETIKKVAAIGYEGVQISGVKGLEPEEIASLVKDAGLKICATHLPWEKFLTDLDEVIRVHKLYKCKQAAIGGLPKEYFSKEGAKRFAQEAKEVIPKLNDAGISFSYHNHNHELAHYEGNTWLSLVYKYTKKLNLNFEIDTYWITAGGGDPAEYLSKYKKRISILHMKDMSITPEREQRFAPVGEGNLNWKRVLKKAGKTGAKWYIVEQDNHYEADAFENVAKSYKFLKKHQD